MTETRRETRFCKQCGKPFKASREDHFFCSAACVAQWYRSNPNPDYIHAEKDAVHTHYCEECGAPYKVNDYAQRGGQRVPKYCSPKCKQKAYRTRGKATQEQAQRRNTGGQQQKPPPRSKTYEWGNAGGQQQQKPPPRTNSRSKRDPYEVLGVERTATKAEIRKAWLKLVKKFHPDKPENRTPENEELIKEVNAAYDKIGR